MSDVVIFLNLTQVNVIMTCRSTGKCDIHVISLRTFWGLNRHQSHLFMNIWRPEQTTKSFIYEHIEAWTDNKVIYLWIYWHLNLKTMSMSIKKNLNFRFRSLRNCSWGSSWQQVNLSSVYSLVPEQVTSHYLDQLTGLLTYVYASCDLLSQCVSTLRSKQNGWQFADNIFKLIF